MMAQDRPGNRLAQIWRLEVAALNVAVDHDHRGWVVPPGLGWLQGVGSSVALGKNEN